VCLFQWVNYSPAAAAGKRKADRFYHTYIERVRSTEAQLNRDSAAQSSHFNRLKDSNMALPSSFFLPRVRVRRSSLCIYYIADTIYNRLRCAWCSVTHFVSVGFYTGRQAANDRFYSRKKITRVKCTFDGDARSRPTVFGIVHGRGPENLEQSHVHAQQEGHAPISASVSFRSV